MISLTLRRAARPLPRSRLAVVGALLPLLSCWGGPSQAGSIELQVAPLISRTPGGPCPTTLTLIENLQPYREGSYGVEGRAPLQALASGWRVAHRDPFSVTWSATLLPAWRRCLAAAGIIRFDNQPYQGHSYLRLRLSGGQATLILDMSGQRDPNSYTPVILSAGITQGQPVWSWGGSD